MKIKTVISEINKKYESNPYFIGLEMESNQGNIRYYDNWYVGFDNKFHKYKTTAIKSCEKTKGRLNLGSTICSEWASLLQIEEKFISINDAKDENYVENGKSANLIDKRLKSILLQNDFYGKCTNSFKRAMGHGYSLILPIKNELGVQYHYLSALQFEVIQLDYNGNITGISFERKINNITRQVYCQFLVGNDVHEVTYFVKTERNKVVSNLENEIIHKGLGYPTFATLHNTTYDSEKCKSLPQSILTNSIDHLKLADDIFNSLSIEFQISIKKLFVSPGLAQEEEYIDEDGNVRKYNTLDYHSSVYSFASTLGDGMDESDGFKEVSFDIREEPHEKGLLLAINLATSGSKLGSNYFSFHNSEVAIQTATQVYSAKNETYRHRLSLVNCNQFQLRKLFRGTIYLDSGKIVNFEDISVGFDDSLITDAVLEREKWGYLVSMGLISKQYYLEKILNLTTDEALREMERMRVEQTMLGEDVSKNANLDSAVPPDDEDERTSLGSKVKRAFNKIKGVTPM